MPFSDTFDSYVAGTGLAGQGTWQLWGVGSIDGQVSNAQSSSPSNSFKMIPQTDIVQIGNVTAGTWELKCMTFSPSTNVGATANEGGFIIGLNTWNVVTPGGATADYSMQIQWDKGNVAGPVVRDYNQTAVGCPVSATAPMLQDQWVQFRAVINLTTNTYSAYYGATQIVTDKSWTKGVLGCTSALNPPVQIQAFDFYSGTLAANTNDAFYIDSVTFAQVVTCYADCDGVGGLTGNDFQCFLDKFVSNNAYADCDGVGGLTGNDFQCFLDKFVAGCS